MQTSPAVAGHLAGEWQSPQPPTGFQQSSWEVPRFHQEVLKAELPPLHSTWMHLGFCFLPYHTPYCCYSNLQPLGMAAAGWRARTLGGCLLDPIHEIAGLQTAYIYALGPEPYYSCWVPKTPWTSPYVLEAPTCSNWVPSTCFPPPYLPILHPPPFQNHTLVCLGHCHIRGETGAQSTHVHQGAEPRGPACPRHWILAMRLPLPGGWPSGKFLSCKIRGLHRVNSGGDSQRRVPAGTSLPATSEIRLTGRGA